MKTDILRSPVKYYGGKGNMISKLLQIVPSGGAPYCEPFCGGASLFFARSPAPVEVLNDLDGRIVGLFRVLQDKSLYEEFSHRVRHTLYSRAEFCRAIEILKDDSASALDRAWATFVGLNQGFSGECRNAGSWSRTFISKGGMADTTNTWLMRLSMLPGWHRRLLMVQIDNRDAIEVIRYWDGAEAVFYVDPPYIHETRKARNVYQREMSNEEHVALVDTLLGCRGAVVLSGYVHPIYERLEQAGWRRVDIHTACHAAGRNRGGNLQGEGAALKHVPRTESIWLNQIAQRKATNAHTLW